MTIPPAVYGQFGMTLAFAERALTATLREHLAKRDTKPETWYALRLIASRGPGLSRTALIEDLQGSREVNPETVPDLLARLEADGLIRGDAELDLTDEGMTQYQSLREYISGPTVRLLSQFELEDVETTVRTLQGITKRAAADSEAPAA
jgi:DNA-binding MarR family transcriptional regulator